MRHNSIHLILAIFCILGVSSTSDILAQEIARDFEISAEGSGSSGLNIPAGTTVFIDFDIISITGEASIEGTDFSESFSSNSGAINSGPFQVTLEPGEYTLTETYSASIASSNSLLQNIGGNTASTTFERAISVSSPSTYTITINTVLRDVSREIGGETLEGQTSVAGVVGEQIPTLEVTAKQAIAQDTPFDLTKTTSGTVASNTNMSISVEDTPSVEHPWDVNGDQTVDILDLVIVGAHLRQTPPQNPAADVTGDGTVNILDLVLVAIHFGESYAAIAAAPIALNRTSRQADVDVYMVATNAGDNLVQVQVHVDSAVELGGAQFDLHFDTERLAFVEVKKGGLFEAQGVQSYWLSPKVTDGELMLASSAIAAPSPPASEDLATVLAQITFRVKSPAGDASDAAEAMESIRLENVRIADADGKSILAVWRNPVDVTPMKDFKNALLQNYPNPFNPETWIPYRLAEDGHVAIKVYDMLGRAVRTIEVGLVPAGEYVTKEHAAYWDGRNEYGEHVSSGVYFYTIEAGGFVATKKLLILK